MKKLWLALFTVLVVVSCKKDIDELPEPTETGANTFGAVVNGELWGPMKHRIINSEVLKAQYYSNGRLLIKVGNYASSPTETDMEIYLYNVQGTGTYQVNENTGREPMPAANYMYFEKRRLTPINTWITSSTHTGTVTITKLDKENKIVAGTFSFDALSIGMNPVALKVTDGRFDLKYASF
jgi:hypothetical protein